MSDRHIQIGGIGGGFPWFLCWFLVMTAIFFPEGWGQIKARFDHTYKLEMAKFAALQSEEK